MCVVCFPVQHDECMYIFSLFSYFPPTSHYIYIYIVHVHKEHSDHQIFIFCVIIGVRFDPVQAYSAY